MPDSEQINSSDDKIEIPKAKKGISPKVIILGVTGYLSVLALMVIGMVYFLKPDITPVVNVQPVVNSVRETNKPAQNEDANDPDINEAVQNLVDEPGAVDISDLVAELKEIEYRSILRNKMESDSVARLQAERETKIARAKLEELKIQTAKLIAARPKPKKLEAELDNVKSNQTSEVASKESENGFKQLAKIYSSMRPTDAAKILNKMETKLVVNLLANMKNRNAAKILSSFTPEKAARISKKINDKFAQI